MQTVQGNLSNATASVAARNNNAKTGSVAMSLAKLEHFQMLLLNELQSAQRNVSRTKDGDCDCVEDASIQSFPCSDPPSWTNVQASTKFEN